MNKDIKVDVVLISAKQGAGKSTLSKAIEKEIEGLNASVLHKNFQPWGFYELIFAGAIYECHNACRDILSLYGVDLPHKKKDGNLLQLLGTEWGRNTIAEDVWVQIVKNRVGQVAHRFKVGGYKRVTIAIPDCRFKNEFEAFPDALRVRLQCPEETRKKRAEMWRENINHPSEVDLDSYEDRFDLVLDSAKNAPNMLAEEVLWKLMMDTFKENRK